MLLTIFLSLTTLFFFSTTLIMAYFVYKWASIIFYVEENLSEAIKVHTRTIQMFKEILSLQVIFDSPHVKNVYSQILEDVKLCRAATLNIANFLNSMEKKQYIIVKPVEKKREDDDDDSEESNQESTKEEND